MKGAFLFMTLLNHWSSNLGPSLTSGLLKERANKYPYYLSQFKVFISVTCSLRHRSSLPLIYAFIRKKEYGAMLIVSTIIKRVLVSCSVTRSKIK